MAEGIPSQYILQDQVVVLVEVAEEVVALVLLFLDFALPGKNEW